MLPFSPQKCIHQIRLTFLDHQIRMATDSARIAEILSDIYASPHFAPLSSESVMNFYCSIDCDDKWDVVMAGLDNIHVAKSSIENPMVFNVFHWYPDTIKPGGLFGYGDHYNGSPSHDTTLELFASHFQRMIMRTLLKNNDSLHFIHAGSLEYNGSGIMLLAPTKGGKSTLTLACIASGMKFLSDDYTLIDLHNGQILPFPRAPRMRKGIYDMIPEIFSLRSGVTIDISGETRYYVNPEHIRYGALGSATKLTHIIKLIGFNDKPIISPTSNAVMAIKCAESDLFPEGYQAVSLIMKWAEIIDNVSCTELKVGSPMETAKMLLDFVKNNVR